MIARRWHGIVPKPKANEYLTYMNETGVKACKDADGNRGVFVLRRNENNQTHYIFLSLWDSLESIRKFAGEDVEKARYFPKDKDYLIEVEPHVIHYEVALHEEVVK